MLGICNDSGPKPRCLVTDLKLSNYINHDDPPRKKKPFLILLSQAHVHTLDLLVPATCVDSLQQNLSVNGNGTLHYAKIHMKLLDIISGDFFTQYIKTPGKTNISMLSEGRSGIDDVYKLHEGKLSLEVDKPTFEQVGLEGKAIPSLGRKHIKQRYLVEIDLRSPSMLSGKKGLERVKWAFQNVLYETKTWLVVDLKDPGGVGEGAMADFQPSIRKVEPMIERIKEALVPAWPEEVKDEDYADAAELLEWIGLAMMISPRVEKDDDVDPYLCRYQVPTAFGETKTQDLVRLRWRGLIYPAFAQSLFLAGLKAAGAEWLAISAVAFDGEAYTILVNGDHGISWEYRD
ncbi:Ribonuclease P protein subunit p40 [Pseudocercospora fuligena]|uniref:Ribonuclease P protein subunit p40 n=1 Tax=Pseudocercospora fuligena TaxID=685502 RepID=A0A8H6VKS5_9PEZI|nr:Ribonuclease P protein subunit p40 [Pseudocercospora fuligena]